MQPLNLLNNVQKARLLHSLMTAEMPNFLAYLNELTESVLNDKDAVRKGWQDQLFGVDFWFELVEDVQVKMARYAKELYKSANVFADQLFGGYTAIFCAHALVQYITLGKHTDPKFRPAVELLFA
jgi:hypothetical protein